MLYSETVRKLFLRFRSGRINKIMVESFSTFGRLLNVGNKTVALFGILLSTLIY